MVFKSQSFIAREIEDTDRKIRKIGYQGVIEFRSPYSKKLVGLPWYLMKHHRRNILLHPQYANRAATRAAVGPIIDGLRARGYTFLTMEQLLSLRS